MPSSSGSLLVLLVTSGAGLGAPDPLDGVSGSAAEPEPDPEPEADGKAGESECRAVSVSVAAGAEGPGLGAGSFSSSSRSWRLVLELAFFPRFLKMGSGMVACAGDGEVLAVAGGHHHLSGAGQAVTKRNCNPSPHPPIMPVMVIE